MINIENSYLVSLVYTKNENGKTLTDLRHAIRECNSREEALGMLILQLDEEMNGWSLTNKVSSSLTCFLENKIEENNEHN